MIVQSLSGSRRTLREEATVYHCTWEVMLYGLRDGGQEAADVPGVFGA